MVIYLLSEDTSNQVQKSFENVLRKTFCNLKADCILTEIEIKYPREHKIITVSNKWRDKDPGSKFRVLCRFLADIYLSDIEFCFWHIDGDRPWDKEILFENTDNCNKMIKQVVSVVESMVVGTGSAFSLERFWRKIIIMEPCYSVEAWLYQNYQKLSDVEAQEIIELKKTNELDFISEIKSKTSFSNQRNEVLSDMFPSKKINELELSYASFFNQLSSNELLINQIPSRS